MYTLVFLSIWGYLWHFIAYFGNTRWFEWGAKKPGNLFVQAFGFTFDSVIEIALAYVFFLRAGGGVRFLLDQHRGAAAADGALSHRQRFHSG